MKKLLSILLPRISVILILVVVAVFRIGQIREEVSPFQFIGFTQSYGYLNSLFVGTDQLPQNQHDVEIYNTHLVKSSGTGIAWLFAPFYALAVIICWIGGITADGYSFPFALMVMLGTVFYIVLGYEFLWRTVKNISGEKIANLLVLLLFILAPLLWYQTMEAPIREVFTVSMLSVFLYFAFSFKQGGTFSLVWLSLSYAFLVLLEPVMFFSILIPVFIHCPSFREIGKTLKEELHSVKLVFVLGLCFVIWLPQIVFLTKSAGNLSFTGMSESYHGKSMIFELLLGVKKGWLLYAPAGAILLLSLFFVRKKHLVLLSLFVIVVLFTVSVLSFRIDWWGGYGLWNKNLLFLFILLSVPAGIGLQNLINRKAVRYVGLLVVLIAGLFNLNQYNQNRIGNYDQQWMTASLYGSVAFKNDASLLDHKKPDIDFAAIKYGIYKLVDPRDEIVTNSLQPLAVNETIKNLKKDVLTSEKWIDELEDTKDQYGVSADSAAGLIAFERIKNEMFTNEGPDAYKFVRILKTQVLNNKDFIPELQKKADTRSISLDSMATLDATWIYRNQYLKPSKAQAIAKFIAELRSNAKMLEEIQIKADKKGISLDSMLVLDATWLYNHKDDQKKEVVIPMERILAEIENDIRSSHEGMLQMKKKANERGIDLDSMIVLDAAWIYKNRDISHYRNKLIGSN